VIGHSVKEPCYATTVPVQSGNSGSPVYDQHNRIIGVISGGGSPQSKRLEVIDYDPSLSGGSHPLSLPLIIRSTTIASTTSIINFLQQASQDSNVKPYIIPLLELAFDREPNNLQIKTNSDNSAHIEYRALSNGSNTRIKLQLGSGSFFKDVTISGKLVDLGIVPQTLISTTNVDELPEFDPPALLKCESIDMAKIYCLRIADNLEAVKFQKQISNNTCTKDKSWGVDDTGLWVDKGCRATFQLNNITTYCASNNLVKSYCFFHDDNALESPITLVQKISQSACQKGRSWDVDKSGLWVDMGCRALFRNTNAKDEIYLKTKRLLNAAKKDEAPRKVTTEFTPEGLLKCQSWQQELEYCILGDKNKLESSITLEKQISGSPCKKGQSWGVDKYGLWVDAGCRALFKLATDSTLKTQNSASIPIEKGQQVFEQTPVKTMREGSSIVYSSELTPTGDLLGTFDDFRFGANHFCKEVGYKGSTGEVDGEDYACINVPDRSKIAARINGSWTKFSNNKYALGENWCVGPNKAVVWVACYR